MQIIPAIDIINGKCVRLSKGDYNQQKIYSDHPLEMAKKFEDAGLQRLHIVDLDGAKAGKLQNLKVLETVAAGTKMVTDFGGGIKTIDDASSVFNAGANMVTLGSIAVKNPGMIEEWVMEFGSDKIFIGADVLDEKIKISGWLEDGGLSIYDFINKMLAIGADNIFCTDISKDGMMEGPSVRLYEKIIEKYPGIKLTASGGVVTLADVLLLKETGCKGAIIGKAIYEGTISLAKLAEVNNGQV